MDGASHDTASTPGVESNDGSNRPAGPDDAEQCVRGAAGDWQTVDCRLSNYIDAKDV